MSESTPALPQPPASSTLPHTIATSPPPTTPNPPPPPSTTTIPQPTRLPFASPNDNPATLGIVFSFVGPIVGALLIIIALCSFHTLIRRRANRLDRLKEVVDAADAAARLRAKQRTWLSTNEPKPTAQAAQNLRVGSYTLTGQGGGPTIPEYSSWLESVHSKTDVAPNNPFMWNSTQRERFLLMLPQRAALDRRRRSQAAQLERGLGGRGGGGGGKLYMQPASGIDLRTNPVSEGKGEGFVDHVRELEKGGPSGVVGPAPRGELASSPEQKSWKTVRNWLTGVEPTDPVDTISEKPSEEEIAENEPPGKKVPVKLKPRQSVLANSIRGVERAARMAYSQTHQQRNAQTEQQQEEGENGESQTVLQRIATAKSQQAYPTPDTSTLLGMLVVQRKETGKKAVVDDAEERRVEVSNIPSSAKFKESKGMGGDGRQLKVPESNVTTERVSGHW